MIKSVFTVLLCVHLLGDFYFQTQKMADKKQGQFSWTICHCLIYGAGSWLLFFLFLPGMKLRYILAFAAAHAAVDIVKYAVCRIFRERRPQRFCSFRTSRAARTERPNAYIRLKVIYR